MPNNPLKRPRDPAGGHWELVCSEISRPFASKTFRLKVPNGWIYAPLSLGRAHLHEMNFHSLWFLYPIEQGPTDRHSHNQRSHYQLFASHKSACGTNRRITVYSTTVAFGAKRTCTDNQVRHVPSAALACAVTVAMCLRPDPVRRAFLLVYRRR